MRIALVGKYVKLHDAYLSVMEALRHAGLRPQRPGGDRLGGLRDPHRENVASRLGDADGVIIPGGFGNRGIEGMVLAAKYAPGEQRALPGHLPGDADRRHRVLPNVCGIKDANSGEFDEYGLHKVIDFMPDQNKNINKGGTLRLGSYPCQIKPAPR